MRAIAADVGPGIAVVALGGYGRSSLSPGSDVDLMILHGERRAERVRAEAERIFYPFWDAGIALGHAVRTIAECLDVAAQRLDAETALLDARLLWGERSLFDSLWAEVGARLEADPGSFLKRLRLSREERSGAHGSCSQLLEPDLKESTGGLRDVHLVAWAARALGTDPAGLAARGMLRAADARALDDAEEFLVRLRSALHLATATRTDRLRLEHQPDLARAFGFDATAGLGAADALMRALFEHARLVEHVAETVLDAPADGESPPGGELPRTAEQALRSFAESAEAGAGLPASLLDAVAETGVLPFGWTDDMRASFLRILAAGQGGSRVLEAADRAGLLVPFVPEWAPVRCRPQRDPYHRFTVDVHLLRATAAAARLLREPKDDPLAAAAAALARPDALLLGAFLHDIGKTGEGPHVPAGVRAARRALERMGVAAATRDDVLFLVEHHLLLADTATRRDLADENLVLDVAATVGSAERLAMLYLLTAADASATGPHAWTPWRQALVRELVAKVERVLERGRMGGDRAADIGSRTRRLRELLPPGMDAYVARLPRAYILAVDPETAARHAPLVDPSLGTAEVRTAARPGERAGTHEVVVVAADRPGLLAKIAGAFALASLNILSAQAFTTEDGVAIDLFVVEPSFAGGVDEDRWRALRTDLRRALEGRISLDYRVREKRQHYRSTEPAVNAQVQIDNGASDFSTVVEVSAGDRVGLLFEIARAFHELELDVHVAKVATYGPRVIDAFYVRDLFGRKVEDPEQLREIERAVLARLSG